MSKYDEALAKLEREAEHDINDNDIRAIAEYVRGRLAEDETAAVRVLDKNKTAQGAYKAVYDAALEKYLKKTGGKKVSGGTYLPQSDIEGIIDRYYGFIVEGSGERDGSVPAPKSTAKPSEAVSLFDLLGDEL